MKRTARAVGVTGALVAGVLGWALVTAPTAAAAARCAAEDAAIYTAPATVHRPRGAVLACRAVTLPQVSAEVPIDAWKVQYASTDLRGAKIAVSGTIAVPQAPWTGDGPRPVIAFHPGTVGMGTQCSLSRQLAGQPQPLFTAGMISDALQAGFAVAATDGVGYLDGQTHTYAVGRNAGHATLDIARAALNTAEFGLSQHAKVGIWGYSEGGAGSLWAAQLAARYAPELHVVGDASGGVPADLRLVASTLDGGPFAGLALDATVGIAAAYPDLPLDSLLNDAGRQAVAAVKTACLLDTVLGFGNVRFADYTTDGIVPEQLFALRGPDGRSWGDVIDDQKLGVGVGPRRSGARYRVTFPVFLYRPDNDQVVGNEQQEALRAAYCTADVTTDWRVYPGTDHLAADDAAIDEVIGWFNDRFAGRPATGNC